MEASIGQILTEGHLEFTCPKCGGITWMRWGDGTHEICGHGICLRVDAHNPLRNDHLHVTCLDCDYEWLVAPLDAVA